MNTLSGSFSPSKKSEKKPGITNSYESLDFKDVPKAVAEGAKQASQEAVKTMWAQIMGTENYAKHVQNKAGELKAGEELDLKGMAKKNEQKSLSEAPMSYFKEIREAGKSGITKEAHEIQEQVQTIIYELKRLATASKAIEKQVAQAVGTGIVSPGKYHETFFTWMLTMVTEARKRVENAGVWLNTVSKKKGAVKSLKKNMNQFMSGERTASNQTS